MKNALSLGLFSLFMMAISCTTVFGQYIYWVDADFLSPRLCRSDLSGGNVTTVPLTSKSLPEGLALDAVHGKIYFSELAFTRANIQGTNANLSGLGAIDSLGSATRGIAVDPAKGKIYWATSNLVSGASIMKANLDGTGKQVLYAFAPGAGANPRGIALQDTMLYWTDFSAGKIRAGNVTGSVAPTDFITALNGPVGIAVGQDGYIYWTEANANAINRRTLVPGSITTLVSGLSAPQYIAVDVASGQMFWTEIGVPRIRKANLNGTTVQTLTLTMTHPTGIAASGSMTVVHGDEEAPQVFALYQNYPNPFNPVTTITFRVPGGGFRWGESTTLNPQPATLHVRLAVYDLLGREVAVLVNQKKEPGTYTVTWNPIGLASGMYLYRLNAESFTDTRKMILAR